MEATEILERAKTDTDLPQGWIVLPLQKNKVAVGILGWIFGVILGLGLFALVAKIVIPGNFEHGTFSIIATLIMLGVLLFVGVGSLWALITDIHRLRNANDHIIVITPTDFVKQEGQKIIHVPLMYVRHVTARGAPPPESAPKNTMQEIPRAGENMAGFLFGRGMVPSGMRHRRRRMRTPTTLAFLDSRTDTEVVVATDNAYGDTFAIAAHLKQYVAKYMV